MDATALPAPLAWHSALTTWRPMFGWDALIAIAALGYGWAWSRVRRAGGSWPWARPTGYYLGLAVLALTLNGFVETYGHTLFWVHMIEHLLLIMVVPILIAVGHPFGLVVRMRARARSRRTSSRGVGLIAAVATYPLVGLGLFAAVIVGTHLSSFMQLMLTHMWIHHVEIALYLGSGYLFFRPLVGGEPIRWRVPYPIRVFLVFLGMSIDTIVGLVLYQTNTALFPAYAAQHRAWGPDPVTDLRWGGVVMWVGGDGLMFVLVLALVLRWITDTAGQDDLGGWLDSVRRTTLAGTYKAAGPPSAIVTSRALDADDNVLAAYNAMLSALAHDEDPGGAQ